MSATRMFVGIPLSKGLTSALSESRRLIAEKQVTWRTEKWVLPENLHITLAFLGEVAHDDAPMLEDALVTVAARHERFNIAISRLKATPSPARCRMIWAQFDDTGGQCARLASSLAAASSPYAEIDRARAFRAHATLCRARAPMRLSPEVLDEATAALLRGHRSMSVPSFTLFTSRLTPQGPIYTERRVLCLGGV